MSDIDKCSLCGLCKANCRIYRITLDESKGPRGKAQLMKAGKDTPLAYMCTLCRACKERCPLGLGFADDILKARSRLNKRGEETKANRKMIENIRKYGNPFGKLKKGEKPKELYCC